VLDLSLCNLWETRTICNGGLQKTYVHLRKKPRVDILTADAKLWVYLPNLFATCEKDKQSPIWYHHKNTRSIQKIILSFATANLCDYMSPKFCPCH
jgi:hypothetical protein